MLDDLAALGIDYDDVVDTLEREGVEKFEASLAELLEQRRDSAGGGRQSAVEPA